MLNLILSKISIEELAYLIRLFGCDSAVRNIDSALKLKFILDNIEKPKEALSKKLVARFGISRSTAYRLIIKTKKIIAASQNTIDFETHNPYTLFLSGFLESKINKNEN